LHFDFRERIEQKISLRNSKLASNNMPYRPYVAAKVWSNDRAQRDYGALVISATQAAVAR
jgi:hypothetical protein